MLRVHLPLLAILALVGTCLASLSEPAATDVSELTNNKTPKSAHLFTDACAECQVIIQKLADVAGDPQKVMELKAILNLLCHETSYETECKMFVSKLDLFLEKLLPYLRNPHTVCHWMHICDNSRIQQFHRVGLLFAKKYVNRVQGVKDLMCEECQFAADELKQLVDDPTYQTEAKQWLSDNVCAHMGHYRGACDTVLDEVMPEFWQELHDLLANPKQFCIDIDLCQASTFRKAVTRVTTTAQPTQIPVQNAQGSQTPSQQQRKKHKVSKRVIQTIFASEEQEE